jgi:CRISPR system Cascade subunit CasC
MITDRLTERSDLDTDTVDRIAKAVVHSFKKPNDKKSKGNTAPVDDLGYLLFFGYRQLDAIVDVLLEHQGELAELEGKPLDDAVKAHQIPDLFNEGHPAEVAMFGRMVADLQHLNVDAAIQVAHAVSTHRVRNYFDYFTAVDDENTEHSGAGMLGNIEFNSATYYRYATVGVHQLHDNLNDAPATVEALQRFIRAFSLTLPTGYQNSFAHQTRPYAVIAAVRTDQPVNLVNAFEEPVTASSSGGYLRPSLTRLAAELSATADVWGQAPDAVYATYTVDDDHVDAKSVKEALGDSVPFPELVTQVGAAAGAWLREQGRS